MKGAMLGAAFWHELHKMSGFVHVDSPRGQSNGPRLATTTQVGKTCRKRSTEAP